MKKLNSTFLVAILLILCTLVIFSIQLLVFSSPRDTAFYLLQDLAFLPLQVAIVTVVLGKILSDREKRERLRKTNMMVGAFYSEVGNEMLELIKSLNKNSEAPELELKDSWTNRDFKHAAAAMKEYDPDIVCTESDLKKLRDLLSSKRNFILLMLANPNLLEHETFTDLLWAIFHLTDELEARNSFDELPLSDLTHLNNDIKRAYKAIIPEWIIYMAHLKSAYPYLFSLELRRNPFSTYKNIIVE